MARQKICIINMGGSLGMRFNAKKNTLEESEIISHLFRHIPELQSRFEIDIIQVYTGNSFNITPDNWKELSEVIHKNYKKYYGFVILHGTSTMTYTASYLSYVFQNLDKPIVFTGSVMPLEELGSEARNNIINACIVATLDITEVLIVYGSKILRANRSKKIEESYNDVFASPNFPTLGEIKRPLILSEERKKRRSRVLKYQPFCSKKVMCIKVTPGFTADDLRQLYLEKGSGLVLEAFGAGVVPTDFEPAIKELIQNDVPVVIASQMHHGIATPFTYNASSILLKSSLIFAYDMTVEAATTKLMWAMDQKHIPLMVKKLMYQNMAGEISDNLESIPALRKY